MELCPDPGQFLRVGEHCQRALFQDNVDVRRLIHASFTKANLPNSSLAEASRHHCWPSTRFSLQSLWSSLLLNDEGLFSSFNHTHSALQSCCLLFFLQVTCCRPTVVLPLILYVLTIFWHFLCCSSLSIIGQLIQHIFHNTILAIVLAWLYTWGQVLFQLVGFWGYKRNPLKLLCMCASHEGTWRRLVT